MVLSWKLQDYRAELCSKCLRTKAHNFIIWDIILPGRSKATTEAVLSHMSKSLKLGYTQCILFKMAHVFILKQFSLKQLKDDVLLSMLYCILFSDLPNKKVTLHVMQFLSIKQRRHSICLFLKYIERCNYLCTPFISSEMTLTIMFFKMKVFLRK